MSRKVELGILHHTDGTTLESALQTLRARNLSYHTIIDVDGTEHKLVPFNVVASHARGVNNISIGVALVGRFQFNPPTDAQLVKLYNLTGRIQKTYPQIEWKNHRDVTATTCPVIDLAAMVKEYHAHQFEKELIKHHNIPSSWAETAHEWAKDIIMPDGRPFFSGDRLHEAATREDLLVMIWRLHVILTHKKGKK